VFFITIRFMFNGDRLAFVKAYHLKDAARQTEFPMLEAPTITASADEGW